MASPLPPRPKNNVEAEVEVKKPDTYLSEKTLLEQRAGKETVENSNLKFQLEQEAGRKMVELNEQRRNRKA
jgi:hypothetical protein